MKSSLLLLALVALIALNVVFAQWTPAALADEVVNLPDAATFTRHFAGHIPLKRGQVQMFYWFLTAKNNPETAPIGIWTSGGPGGQWAYTIIIYSARFHPKGPFNALNILSFVAGE
jgi:hypothetical protein